MFETKAELRELQRLLDDSFARAEGIRYSGFEASQRLSASQLSGFQGIRLVACATVNSKGEPRAAPRSAAFLHGKFYLATNSGSTMVRRLSLRPALGFTYFENHLLIMGHATVTPLREGTPGFKERRPEWVEAFQGGKDSIDGTDMLLRVDPTHVVAFATHPEKYPEGWRREHPRARDKGKASRS
jgi:hypothetical protein